MFYIIKKNISLLQVLEQDLSLEFKPLGEKNWVIDGGKDVERCPFCDHHGCFRVNHVEDDNPSSFYKCFSCGESGDVISWRSKTKKIGMKDAAKQLAAEFNIQLPRDYNPIQEIFSLAADYYHNCLLEVCNRPYPILEGRTPLRYQLEVRNRKESILKEQKVGFSDGNLIDYLSSLGIDEEVIANSGLKSTKTGKDFLPSNCFIYPHYVKGRVSHFTFKDPLKRIQYQLPKKYSLNGYMFYGQDSVGSAPSIALVEGENDRLSVLEVGGAAVLASIGQLSGEQLDWLRENCKGKRIVTLFDPDDAGDKYREKIELIKRNFSDVIHILPPDNKDIDEHLSNGADFVELIKANRITVTVKGPEKKIAVPMPWDISEPIREPTREPIKQPASDSNSVQLVAPAPDPKSVAEAVLGLPGGTSVQVVGPSPENLDRLEVPTDDDAVVQIDNSSVIQMKNCYYKVIYKDGVPDYVRLSNFTIELRNIFIDEENNDRRREIVIRRCDGYRSEPFEMDSETKVSVIKFKVLMAKMADAEWNGKDADLDNMWRLVYSQYPEIVITLVRQVGRIDKYKSWIFKNILITDSGTTILPDENGVFWINGKSSGIKLKGITDSEDLDGIPALNITLSREEAYQLLSKTIGCLQKNFKSLGHALTTIGWIYANLYSNSIYREDGGFGSLMLWGKGGQGKSTLCRWTQKFFGLTDKMASTSIQQLKTGVGFMRKGAFYASVPLLLDEIRADELSNSYLGMIRSWYDREARVIADKDKNMVRNLPIRSTLMMAGEDLPDDPATRQRCIMIRVPPVNTETEDMQSNYRWLNENSELFSNITYYWIIDSLSENQKTLLNGIRELDKALVKAGCSNRISKVWASAGYFAAKLGAMFFPEYDYMNYLIETCKKEQEEQTSDNTLMRFFEDIAAVRVRENSRITDEHIMRDGHFLHIWFYATFKEISEDNKRKKEWSKNAIQKAIKEEPYYVSDNKKIQMGIRGARKIVMTLDLRKCPSVLQEMMEYYPEDEMKDTILKVSTDTPSGSVLTVT
jgi:5S rRNA maturation endonuclease (ribonuclease M5)